MGASGHAIHLGFMCLCISAIFVSVNSRISTLKTPTCSTETSQGSLLPCTLSLKACKPQEGIRRRAPSSSSSSSPSSSSSVHMEPKKEEEEEEEEKIIVKEKVVRSARSLIDINFMLLQTRRAAVVVQRRGSQHHHQHHQAKGSCMVMMLELKEPGNVTLADLTLLHGAYEVKLFKNGGGRGKGGGGGGGGGLMELSHYFFLPFSVRISERSRTLSRQRRHKTSTDQRRTIPTEELILQNLGPEEEEEEEEEKRSNSLHINHGGGEEEEGRGGGGYQCLCCKCFNFKLDYDDFTAVLTFNYSLNSSCGSACSDVNVQLYRDESETEDQCGSERLTLLVQGVERIGLDRNVTKGPVLFRDIRRGCYFIELKPQLYRMPERTHFLWAEPSIQVTNMNNWTTVFFLDPNPQRRSMMVRWSVVRPYNFSEYELTLHHHAVLPIKCTGKEIFPNMSIIPAQGRLVLSKPEYPFFNLSSGWYCARVTPRDERCPIDGCQVISSRAVHLSEPEEWTCSEGVNENGECVEGSALGLSLLVVGCVVGALVTGVTVAWGLLHLWPSLSQFFSTTHYSPVPLRTGAKASRGQKQVVLLVWTPQGPYGVQFMPIIAAFKTVLRTYGNCEVYDYLELSSLPEKHQLQLLSAPTTWLDSILANHSIKVIIVATEGAWEHQVEWSQVTPTPSKKGDLTSTPGNAHDQILFPYLLRRLHEQTDLAGDYSRVFHVRFSDVSPASVELTHVVSLKRYKIPEHLKSLATSVHGGGALTTFEDPKDDQLAELRAALSLHPNFRGHMDPKDDPQRLPLVENGHSTIPDVAINCVRVSEGSKSVTPSVDSSPVANGSVREIR